MKCPTCHAPEACESSAACPVNRLAKADKLVSRLHDALWEYDGQPHPEMKRPTWDLARDEMNGLVWKLHDLLRAT